MKLGIRGKLFAVSVALLAAFGFVAGALVEHRVRTELEARLEADLAALAQAARAAIEVSGATVSPSELAPVLDRLGEAFGARVTVIGHGGQVLGDTELEIGELPTVENHAQRPEIGAALAGEIGVARRYSQTVHRETLYRAIGFRAGGTRGVVRVALPVEAVERSMAWIRPTFVGAGLVALAIAAFMSGLSSHLLSRAVRNLLAHAQTLASGADPVRLPGDERDELGGLEGSLRRLAAGLDRTVEELALERDRLGAVLEGMTEGLLALDAEQRITLVNPVARRQLGLDETALGSVLLEAVRLPALADLTRAALDGEGARAEFEWGEPESRTLEARAARLGSEGGVVIVLHDVTDLRRLEKVRRDFVANVSHELRTPVASIRANAETLLGGALDDPDRSRDFLDALVRNAERLGRLISDLLDLSRIESGAYALDVEPLTLAPLVGRIVVGVERVAEQKGIELTSAIDPDLRVRADENALEQVVANLLDNAIKYTPAGGHVAIEAVRRGDEVRIEVSDDGPGIPAHQRSRVFERFYRVDVGRSRDLGGTGLGLAIVRHLVESMGGAVGLEENAPHGCVFHVDLPA